MQLREFVEKDQQLLINWIDSEQLNYLWGGPSFSYPLTNEQITTHCNKPEVFPFLFTSENSAVGYVELYKMSPDHYRICRVFVANEYRGKGISTHMLSDLIEFAHSQFNAKRLSLAVFEHNKAAIRCYRGLGFQTTLKESNIRSFNGVAWDLLSMEKQL